MMNRSVLTAYTIVLRAGTKCDRLHVVGIDDRAAQTAIRRELKDEFMEHLIALLVGEALELGMTQQMRVEACARLVVLATRDHGAEERGRLLPNWMTKSAQRCVRIQWLTTEPERITE